VGDIRDEYDRALPAMRALRDGSYLVPGSWRLDECARDTGIALPAGDYETLSGLVMAHLGRVPRVGDQVDTSAARLLVEALDGFAVRSIRIQPNTGEQTDPGTTDVVGP
jgi:CBS domain containing-hemolysin-like protein